MTTKRLLLLFFTLPLSYITATPVHAACFCSGTVYYSDIVGAISNTDCSSLAAFIVDETHYHADRHCFEKGFDSACDVQTQLGPCQPQPSGGVTMYATYNYRCLSCVDRDPRDPRDPPEH